MIEVWALRQVPKLGDLPRPRPQMGTIALGAKFPSPSADRRETLPNDAK